MISIYKITSPPIKRPSWLVTPLSKSLCNYGNPLPPKQAQKKKPFLIIHAADKGGRHMATL
jgi:hypothetical protein